MKYQRGTFYFKKLPLWYFEGDYILIMNVYKIKKNYDFRIVYNRGRSFSNKLFILYIYKNKKNLDINRLGISVSKKVGKSVIRNKIRRLIYEVYRLNLNKLKNGYDIVFIVRMAAKDRIYGEIEKSINDLFNKSLILLWGMKSLL